MLPNQITLSQLATNKLQHIKTNTGITPNILSRIAIMLAIKDKGSIANTGVNDTNGQVLNKSVLFGEHTEVYDVIINQFVYENDIEMPLKETIAALIEAGVHKMGHIKQLSDISKLK